MVKILITGAKGFIGKNLESKLKLNSNYEIISSERNTLNLISQNEVDEFFKKHNHIDVVLHCAVRGANRIVPKEPSMFYENIYALENLLRYKSNIGKLIYFGSGAESDMDCYYGFSKFVIANRLLQIERAYNLRLFGVFGESEASWRFIKNSINSALRNEPIKIIQNRYISFFYVDDLCKLVEYYINNESLEKEIDAVYNKEVTPPASLEDYAKLIKKLCKSNSKIVYETSGWNNPYVGNDTIIKTLNVDLGGFNQGLLNEINYIKNGGI